MRRAMRPTPFIYAGIQLAVTVLLPIVPFISATPSQPARSSRCVGDPGEICGDSSGLNLHRNGFARQSGPTIAQTFGQWEYLDCYPDSNGNRILTTQITGGFNTVEYCLDACNGYNLAGLEFGAECWCGNSLAP